MDTPFLPINEEILTNYVKTMSNSTICMITKVMINEQNRRIGRKALEQFMHVDEGYLNFFDGDIYFGNASRILTDEDDYLYDISVRIKTSNMIASAYICVRKSDLELAFGKIGDINWLSPTRIIVNKSIVPDMYKWIGHNETNPISILFKRLLDM